LGNVAATENSKSKNGGKERQTTRLKALGFLPLKPLLLQELPFYVKSTARTALGHYANLSVQYVAQLTQRKGWLDFCKLTIVGGQLRPSY
jgi:hypothetical protein